MNDLANNPQDFTYRAELTGVLLESVEEILGEPIDEKDLARALDRGRQANYLAISNHPRRSRKLLAVAAITAALLFVAIILWNRQSNAWAQVVEAVAKKPWLHAVSTLPDGKKGELWFSADRAIIVTQIDKMVDWSDLKQKSREFYNPEENTLVRVSDDQGRGPSSLWVAVLKALLSSETGRSINAERSEFVHQQQRVVNKEGKRCIEHRFKYHHEDNQHERNLASCELIIYVDFDTQLPFRWEQILQFKKVDKETEPRKAIEMVCEIDYPETGPADIYALGVPKTAKVLDRLLDNTPADVKRLLGGVRAARWQSDKYYALVVEVQDNQHGSRAFPLYRRVWRSGSRWRVEQSFGYVPPEKMPPKETDPATWWKQRAEKVQFEPYELCDGKWLWLYLYSSRAPTQAEVDAGAPKDKPFIVSNEKQRRPAFPPRTDKGDDMYCADNHPEYLARPLPEFAALGYSPDEVKLVPKPASGPPNTVLLEVHNSHWTSGGYYPQMWRYWIDPEQGYLVMRYEELVTREGKEEIIRGHAIEGVTQDPQGQWYPTVIRLFKRNVLIGSEKPRYDGIMRCYYDFDAPMPDSLFEP